MYANRILINATGDMRSRDFIVCFLTCLIKLYCVLHACRPAPGEVCVESIDGGWRRKFVFGEIVKGKSNGTYYCNETYLGGRMKHKLTIWNVAVIERSTSPPGKKPYINKALNRAVATKFYRSCLKCIK